MLLKSFRGRIVHLILLSKIILIHLCFWRSYVSFVIWCIKLDIIVPSLTLVVPIILWDLTISPAENSWSAKSIFWRFVFSKFIYYGRKFVVRWVLMDYHLAKRLFCVVTYWYNKCAKRAWHIISSHRVNCIDFW